MQENYTLTSDERRYNSNAIFQDDRGELHTLFRPRSPTSGKQPLVILQINVEGWTSAKREALQI